MSACYCVVLPMMGSPYILGKPFRSGDDKALEQLQAAVDGYIESGNRKSFIIHPMFAKEDKRWAMAQKMLEYSKTKVYVNEEGKLKCDPNMATIIVDAKLRRGIENCPHIFGEIALAVPVAAFPELGIDPTCLKPCPEVVDKRGVIVGFINEESEYEDEEAAEAEFQTKCRENGWDYIESTGAAYLAPVA